MFNIGGGELIVIALLALIVLGPNRLPGAARQVGKVIADLRRISSGFQDEVRTAFDAAGRDEAPSSPEPAAAPAPQLDAAIGAVSAQASAKATAAKRAPAKRTTAKKATAKQATAKKVTAKKATAKKATATKATATKATATKATATKATATKATAKRSAPVSTAARRRSPS